MNNMLKLIQNWSVSRSRKTQNKRKARVRAGLDAWLANKDDSQELAIKNAKALVAGILAPIAEVKGFADWLLIVFGGSSVLLVSNIGDLLDIVARQHILAGLVGLALGALLAIVAKILATRVIAIQEVREVAEKTRLEINDVEMMVSTFDYFVGSLPWYARQSAERRLVEIPRDPLYSERKAASCFYQANALTFLAALMFVVSLVLIASGIKPIA